MGPYSAVAYLCVFGGALLYRPVFDGHGQAACALLSAACILVTIGDATGCGECGGAGRCDDRGTGRSLVEAIYGFAEATRFGPFRRNPKMAASVGEGDVFRAFRSTAECHVRKSHISSGLAAVRT